MSFSCVPLNSEALLRVQGPDAASFLQGQLTCDVNTLQPGSSLPGVYCNPQGRVVSDFLLYQLDLQDYALRLRKDALPLTRDTLQRYAVFSKVSLEPAPDSWQLLACWGQDAAARLSPLPGPPVENYHSVQGEGFIATALSAGQPAFELLVLTGDSAAAALLLDGAGASEQDWLGLMIEAGAARIEAAGQNQWLPQMLNYDLTGHISFRKGCFPGQEVVARLHYKGTAKRRLYGYRGQTSQPVEIGDKLYAAGGDKAVGNVCNRLLSDTGEIRLLACVATESAGAVALQPQSAALAPLPILTSAED